MFLTNPAMVDIGAADATVVAILGYAVVFLGLFLLMLVVIALGKAMAKAQKKKETAPAAAETATIHAAEGEAAGTAGELKLYDVSPRDAAMIMAIVAEKTGRPLNELRFKSIKEVK